MYIHEHIVVFQPFMSFYFFIYLYIYIFSKATISKIIHVAVKILSDIFSKLQKFDFLSINQNCLNPNKKHCLIFRWRLTL